MISMIASQYLKRKYKLIEMNQRNPLAAQERAFERLQRRLADTAVSHETNLGGFENLRDFVHATPIRNHSDFEPMIERATMKGERHVMYHDDLKFVGLSSGTMGGKCKKIPFNTSMVQVFADFQMSFAAIIERNSPVRFMRDDRLTWGSSPQTRMTEQMIPCGYVSGFLATRSPGLMKRTGFPSVSTSHIDEMGARIRATAREVRNRDIRFLSGVPTYILHLLEELKAEWKIDDFSQIWPNLSTVVYSATAIDPYRAQIEKLIGRPLQFLGVYASTEGPLGYEIPSVNGGGSGVYSLHFGDIVYSFRDLHRPDSSLMTVAELQAGMEVEIILSSPNGLLQYAMGDALKILDVRPSITFEVLGRIGQGLNVATEKVPFSQLQQAVVMVSQKIQREVSHFFVHPGQAANGRACYEWTLLVEDPESLDINSVSAELDSNLIKLNADYEENRIDTGFLERPIVHFLPKDVFKTYFQKESHRGQLKMKSAFDSAEAFRGFMSRLLKPATAAMTLGCALLLSAGTATAAPECRSVMRAHESTRHDCRIETDRGPKTMHYLHLKGDFARIAYDHAYLLSEESQNGVLREAIERMNRDLSAGNFATQQFHRAIAGCLRDRILGSVSDEFKKAVGDYYWGLRHGMEARRQKLAFDYQQVLMAAIGIELSIAFEGMQKRMKDDPMGTFAEVTSMCGLQATRETFETVLDAIGGVGKGMKFGCLGFVAPASVTSSGHLLHARNFDANMVESWNLAPSIFLIEEPGYYKYVATSAAGMMYPGGISGFNEKGISVSLHEMSTTKYRTATPAKKGVIAPFLQQRILREAASLDEAIRLIKTAKHFGAWTILLSDSKTNEIASVEFSGDRVQVGRRLQNQALGQTNHFLGSQMHDQAFTYNFNKRLESESRLLVIDRDMQKDWGQIDIDWAIAHLSGHEDAFEGFRSFGRTATKAYTVMSTVAIPGQNEFWVTLGERRPASHSTFVGFHVDFDRSRLIPFSQKRNQAYAHIPQWEESLSMYSEARLQYEKGNRTAAVDFLSRAIESARKDGITEYPYYYMRARVNLEMKRRAEAMKDFEFLFQNRSVLHPYQQALVAMYSVAANPGGSAKLARLQWAESIFTKLLRQYQHFDLRNKISVVRALKNSSAVNLPAIDFVTVE